MIIMISEMEVMILILINLEGNKRTSLLDVSAMGLVVDT